MDNEPIIKDDFYYGAGALRMAVLKKGFGDVEFHGQLYHGISLMPPPAPLLTALSDLVGYPVEPVVQHFCLSGAEHVLESGAYIHADSIFAPRVAILYLTAPANIVPRSGTALWQHKKTGWDSMPGDAQFEHYPGGRTAFLEDWKDPDAWHRTAVIEQKFNRVAVYPAARFHSRWPFVSAGTTPFNSRLIWTVWFNNPQTDARVQI